MKFLTSSNVITALLLLVCKVILHYHSLAPNHTILPVFFHYLTYSLLANSTFDHPNWGDPKERALTSNP